MSETVAPTAPAARTKRRYPPLLVIASLTFLAAIVAVFALADILAPFDYRAQALRNRLAPPVFLGGSWSHLLGTDELGRDIWSRLLFAIRFSLMAAFGGTVIGALIGATLGFVAAHFRGAVEETILMLADVQASLPFMLIALSLIAVFGSSFLLFVIIMGFYGWETFARLTRGAVLSTMGQGYAQAVTALGATSSYWPAPIGWSGSSLMHCGLAGHG